MIKNKFPSYSDLPLKLDPYENKILKKQKVKKKQTFLKKERSFYEEEKAMKCSIFKILAM